MASFKTILTGIEKVLGVAYTAEHAIAPLLGAVVPGLALVDGIFTRVMGTIATVEANDPAAGQGQVKSAAVQNDFAASLALTQEVLKAQGKLLTYDGDALQRGIDAQVAAYNAFAAVKASFKITDLSK